MKKTVFLISVLALGFLVTQPVLADSNKRQKEPQTITLKGPCDAKKCGSISGPFMLKGLSIHDPSKAGFSVRIGPKFIDSKENPNPNPDGEHIIVSESTPVLFGEFYVEKGKSLFFNLNKDVSVTATIQPNSGKHDKK